MATREGDGRWSQNMYLQEMPCREGVEIDEVALPIVLLELAHPNNYIDDAKMKRYWLRIKKAVSFIVTHGSSTEQDRCEEESSLTAFTPAAEISVLLSAAL